MGCAASTRADGVRRFTEDNCRFHHTYTLGALLGAGAYGAVFVASRIDSNDQNDSEERCAVKVVSIEDRGVATDCQRNAVEEFRNERTVWARVGENPNIVSFFDWHMDDKFGYLVMELCHSSLLQAWRVEADLNEYTYAQYFTEMVLALRHIHSLGIVHRDIKHENFLVGGSTRRTLKLCDFGLAASQDDLVKLSSPGGTPAYMAPEVVTPNETAGTSSDVWSFGVIVYVAFFGRWLYQPRETSRTAMCEAIRSGNPQPQFKPSPRFNQEAVSDVAIDFARAVLNRNSKARCSADDCLQMDYLRMQDIRSVEARSRGTCTVSLQPVLKAAIHCGAFTKSDPQKHARMLSRLTERQMRAQTTPAARSQCQPSMCTLQPNRMSGENPGFDNIFEAAPASQNGSGLEKLLPSSGTPGSAGKFPSSVEAVLCISSPRCSNGGQHDFDTPLSKTPFHPCAVSQG